MLRYANKALKHFLSNQENYSNILKQFNSCILRETNISNSAKVNFISSNTSEEIREQNLSQFRHVSKKDGIYFYYYFFLCRPIFFKMNNYLPCKTISFYSFQKFLTEAQSKIITGRQANREKKNSGDCVGILSA